MKRKLAIKFTKTDLNYTGVTHEAGAIVWVFPLDITPILLEDGSTTETVLSTCKCKVTVKCKCKSKMLDLGEMETLTVMGKISSLDKKDNCYKMDEIDDWFVDTYYKRVESDDEVEIKEITIVSDQLGEQLAPILSKNKLEDKIGEAKDKLGSKLKKATELSKMPKDTTPPKVKGRTKSEGKKLS